MRTSICAAAIVDTILLEILTLSEYNKEFNKNHLINLIITFRIMTFNNVSVMCSNSTDCDDGQFCHIPDGQLEGECHTQFTLTAYIQESINNLTTTTPKPKPKGVNSI